VTRFIMSRLPLSWVEDIDFFMHRRRHVPRFLWRPICDELDRRYGVDEETLEEDRRRRQQKKWWKQ